MVEVVESLRMSKCRMSAVIVQVALMTGPVHEPLRQPNTDTTLDYSVLLSTSHITIKESFLILQFMGGLNGQSVSLGVKY